MFPQVAPKFFASRSEGPKNLGKDPGAGSQDSVTGTPPVARPISYDVTLNGRSHRVSVTPVA